LGVPKMLSLPRSNQRSGAVVSVLGSKPKDPWIETTLR
jgi:hypothetical protein